MKALILAAGRGRRMKGLTEDRPKALLTVGGRPLLQHALENLRSAGVTEVGIVTGYRAETLYWPEFSRRFHNPDWATTQMVYSLFRAQEWLPASDTVVCYSDIIFTSRTIETLVEKTGDIVIANNVDWHDVWSKRFADPLVDAETFKRDSDGFLTEIGKRPTTLADVQGQYMGLIKITPKGWKQFDSFRDGISMARFSQIDMTSTLNELIQRKCRISTADVREDWYEFDSEDDLIGYR